MINIYAGTLGELIIVELFVLWIWIQVLFDAIKATGPSKASFDYKKLLLTSIALVLNAFAITGIITYRVYELLTGTWPFIAGIVAFFAILAISGFLLIVAASLGTNGRLIKVFFVVSAAWAVIVLLMF